jgi:hypothetical protein
MHYFRRQSYEVAAICLGQPLPRLWVIHHLDENPENNEPSNLLLFRHQSAHAGFHQQVLKLQRAGQAVDVRALAIELGGRPMPEPPQPLDLSVTGVVGFFPED